MKKNVASQSIGVQMITAADGTAFTGAVSVLVTLDNGTQTAGGGTAPAHEGNGYHSYTPTQAETNADHIAYTFTGTGVIPATVQVYTTFPQTGDGFARLGVPAGDSVSADLLAIDNFVDGIEASLAAGVTVTTNNDKTGYALSAAGVDAIYDEATAGHVTAGTYGVAINDILVDTGTTLQAELDGIQADTEDIQTRLPAALVGGRMDADMGAISTDATAANNLEAMLDGTGGADLTLNALVFNPTGAGDCIQMGGSGAGNGIGFTRSGAGEVFDAAVAAAIQTEAADALTAYAPATAAALAVVDDFIDTEVAAIKAKTDQMVFTKANELDINLQSVNGVTVNGDGAATPMGV